MIRDALERDGVAVMTGATAHHAVRRDAGWQLTITRGAISDTLDADHVLVAVGRRANTEGLALAAAGIGTDASGRVIVNDFLRTANRRIYAAGDVCLPWQFTHAADWSARLVIRNALFAGRARVSALVLPRATFTDPELAAIGLTLDDAQARGEAVTPFEVPFATVDRAITDAARADSSACWSAPAAIASSVRPSLDRARASSSRRSPWRCAPGSAWPPFPTSSTPILATPMRFVVRRMPATARG